MGYLEYLPPDYPKSGKSYPLLIFLHGSGERGNGSPGDLERVKSQGVPKQIKNGATMCFDVNGTEECFIVLSPQTMEWGWANTIVSFTEFAVDHYPVDADRVYVTGLSMGGKGSWEAGYTNHNVPNHFAALAPVSADGSTSNMDQIADYHIPVWAFHGSNDWAIPLTVGQQLVNALINAGADPEPLFTIYEGYGHSAGMWDKVYSTSNTYHDPNVYQWLLMQRRYGSEDKGNNQLNQPSNMSLSINDKMAAVDVSWNDVDPEATNVIIQRRENSNNYVNIATVAASNTKFTDTEVVNDHSYYYRIQYTNGDINSPYSPEKEILFSVNIGGEQIIIDNKDAGFQLTGNWATSTYSNNKYGSNYYHDNNSGKGSKSAGFTASVEGGNYAVFSWWVKDANRATSVKYEVTHANGTATLSVDQRNEGNGWIYLGNYDFNSTAKVVIKNDGSDGYVIADAMKFVKNEPDNIQIEELILDNNSNNVSMTGYWESSTAGDVSKYGQNYYHDNNAAKGAKSLTYNAGLTGTYNVYGWWYAFGNRATNTPFSITYKNGTATVTKNQRQDNARWVLLGTYEFDGTAKVKISNNGTNGFVVADAIKFERVADDEPQELVLDNDDSGVSTTGSWITSKAGNGSRYGTSYFHDNNAGKGNKSVIYEVSLNGTYEVFGWWYAFENRASNTPFAIKHINGTTTVTKNQRQNDARWVSLGTYTFDGAGSVKISNTNTNGHVIADAIKFVRSGNNQSRQANASTKNTLEEGLLNDEIAVDSKLFPNPVEYEMNITIGSSHADKGQYQLMDMSGKTIYRGEFDQTENSAIQLTNELSGMKNGIGILKISSSSKSEIIRFIKR